MHFQPEFRFLGNGEVGHREEDHIRVTHNMVLGELHWFAQGILNGDYLHLGVPNNRRHIDRALQVSRTHIDIDLIEHVFLGLHVLEVDIHLLLDGLQGVEGNLVLLLGVARHVDGIGPIDKESGVLIFNFPTDGETLVVIQPVLHRNGFLFALLSLHVQFQSLLGFRFQCFTNQIVKQGRTIGQREEQGTTMGIHGLGLGGFILSHGQGMVFDGIVRGGVRRNLHNLIPLEERSELV